MKRLPALLAAPIALIAVTAGLSTAASAAASAVVPVVGATPSSASSSWGHASAKDQTIKGGCRDYRFHYAVTAPGDEWMAELTLINPNGRKVSTRTFESAAEKASGAGTFELCKATTSAGRYRIAMKVTSYDARDSSARKAEPGRFRLTERR